MVGWGHWGEGGGWVCMGGGGGGGGMSEWGLSWELLRLATGKREG